MTLPGHRMTWKVATHQQAEGLGVSIENPKGGLLQYQPEFVKTFGTMGDPKPGWYFYRSEGCQLKVAYPGIEDPGRPIQKATFWLTNLDLSSMELRCRKPGALLGTSHYHRHALGGMMVPGEGWRSVANYTGKYTAEHGAVYAKPCRAFCETVNRKVKRPATALTSLADRSTVARGEDPSKTDSSDDACNYRHHGTRQFLLSGEDQCYDLVKESHRSSPLLSLPLGTCPEPATGANQFSRSIP